jgi:hypothetical protein
MTIEEMQKEKAEAEKQITQIIRDLKAKMPSGMSIDVIRFLYGMGGPVAVIDIRI